MPFGAVLKELQRSTKSSPSISGSVSGITSPDQSHTTSRSESLRNAASAGDFDRVKELCKKSVAIDADGEGRTALHYASLNGHLQIVKEIVNAGAKVNVRDASGFTPLHLASSEGHVEIVTLLLKSGALIDSQDDLQASTPLHEAAWKGFRQTVEVLMKHKANPYLKKKNGFSALHLCCQQGHNGSTRVLLMYRCKPDLKNDYGDTPLHTAARYGHAGVARILISAFCDVNQVNKNGDTALHITAAMGRRKLTKILLQAGCDPTLKNQQNETAMDIALRKSLKEVQEIIANPPPLRLHRSVSMTRFTSKKREKESSQEGSKTSGRRARKDGRLLKKESPYGCPRSPDLREFPKLKIDSLPQDPLRRGEQYYFDLAGNIKKGPVNRVPVCSCKPLFEKVEMKMDVDKQELKDHIDCKSEHLKEKIGVLEKKTLDMGETLKEKIACERAECIQRSMRNSLRDKIEFERKQLLQVQKLKGDMKHWLESRLSASCGQLHMLNQQIQKQENESDESQRRQQPLDSVSCTFDLTRPSDHHHNHHLHNQKGKHSRIHRSQSAHPHPNSGHSREQLEDADSEEEDDDDEDEDREGDDDVDPEATAATTDQVGDRDEEGESVFRNEANRGKGSVKRSSSSSSFPSHSQAIQQQQQQQDQQTGVGAGCTDTRAGDGEMMFGEKKTHVRFAPTASNRQQEISEESRPINLLPQGVSRIPDKLQSEHNHHHLQLTSGRSSLRPQPLPRITGPVSRSQPQQQQQVVTSNEQHISLLQPQLLHHHQQQQHQSNISYQTHGLPVGTYQSIHAYHQPQMQQFASSMQQPKHYSLVTRQLPIQQQQQSQLHHLHQQHVLQHQPHHGMSVAPSEIKIHFPLANQHAGKQVYHQHHHHHASPKISVSIPDVLGSSGGSLGTASGGSNGSNGSTACPQFNSSPSNASPDEPSNDLMKSLRCNPSWTHREMRDSPNTESSGYRTKFSPSPREQAGISHISNTGPVSYLGQLSSSLV